MRKMMYYVEGDLTDPDYDEGAAYGGDGYSGYLSEDV